MDRDSVGEIVNSVVGTQERYAGFRDGAAVFPPRMVRDVKLVRPKTVSPTDPHADRTRFR